MMHHYRFFGLSLCSIIELPGLTTDMPSAIPDITISWGAVVRPADEMDGWYYKPDSVCHRHCYFLEVDDIARYYIDRGGSISIERLSQASDQDIAVFLLDTVLTALLLMRDKYVFHASAVRRDNRATMICGRAGAGKSAIALHLVHEGYDFIEDDRCLPFQDAEKGIVLVRNCLPYIDVWKTELKLVEKMPELKLIGALREEIAKERFDMTPYLDTAAPTALLQQVVIIQTDNLPGPIKVTKVIGIRKFQLSRQFAHKHHLIPYLGSPTVQFRHIMELLSTIPVYVVKKTRDHAAQEVADFIKEHIIEGDTSTIPLNTVEHEDS